MAARKNSNKTSEWVCWRMDEFRSNVAWWLLLHQAKGHCWHPFRNASASECCIDACCCCSHKVTVRIHSHFCYLYSIIERNSVVIRTFKNHISICITCLYKHLSAVKCYGVAVHKFCCRVFTICVTIPVLPNSSWLWIMLNTISFTTTSVLTLFLETGKASGGL